MATEQSWNQQKYSGKNFKMILCNWPRKQEVQFGYKINEFSKMMFLRSLWISVHKENKQGLEIIGDIRKEVYNIFFFRINGEGSGESLQLGTKSWKKIKVQIQRK